MNIFWKNSNQTILVWEFSETWIWREYDSDLNKIRLMIKDINHAIFMIIDGSKVKRLPEGVLHHFNESNQNIPSNIAMCILVTKHGMLRKLAAILQRTKPSDFENFYCVRSMGEAETRIAKAQNNCR